MRLDSTRKAIHDALTFGWNKKSSSLIEYLTYETKIEKSFHSETVSDGLEAGYILAAVHTQHPPIAAWLTACYGPDEEMNEVSLGSLSSFLRFKLFPISNHKKHSRILSLCKIGILDYKMSIWSNRQMLMGVYCHEMGVREDNFKRDWGKSLDRLMRELTFMDSEGVGNVSVVLKSLRTGKDSSGLDFPPNKALRYIDGRV